MRKWPSGDDKMRADARVRRAGIRDVPSTAEQGVGDWFRPSSIHVSLSNHPWISRLRVAQQAFVESVALTHCGFPPPAPSRRIS